MSSSEITRYQESEGLLQLRSPAQVLAEAKQAAVALTEVIRMKPNPVKFNGEIYLEFEDWQTCAKFYGCTVKVLSTNLVQIGDVRGFEATAVVLDRNQNVISQAEGMCLDDEDTWGMVAKYEWQDELDENGKKIWIEGRDGKKRPKSKKVKVGEVKKPLFQLKSMAQTRACARALRQVFAWVVVLAGYKPSVAEEMTGDEEPSGGHEDNGVRRPVQQPTRASEKKAEPQNNGLERISGKIETLKEGKEGAIFVDVDKKIVVIRGDLVDDTMKVGAVITVSAKKEYSQKLKSDTYFAVTVLENPPEAATGEVAEGESPKLDSEPKPEGNATLGELFDSGSVKKGSEVETPKTIGLKRAQRLWALMNQNKQTTGLTEEIVRTKILAKLPKPLEHLHDLDFGMNESFEKIMTGEMDWRALVEEQARTR
jgi:hypothetical protein